MSNVFETGDRVEVVTPKNQSGMRGIVVSSTRFGCVVRIKSAGHSDLTKALVGKELPYVHKDLKAI